MFSSNQTPRPTGDVSMPLAVTVRMLACPNSPPRRRSVRLTLWNPLPGGRLESVQLREPLVDEGKLGVEEVDETEVLIDQMPREQPRLLPHRLIEIVVVERPKLVPIRRHRAQVAKSEPAPQEPVEECVGLGDRRAFA